MKVNIKTTNITLTDEIADYLKKHLISQIEKFVKPDDESAMLSIEIGRTTKHHQKGDIYRAEANFHMAGCDLRAEAERSALFTAIDEVKYEITRELMACKKKRFDLLRRGARKFKNFLRDFRRGK